MIIPTNIHQYQCRWYCFIIRKSILWFGSRWYGCWPWQLWYIDRWPTTDQTTGPTKYSTTGGAIGYGAAGHGITTTHGYEGSGYGGYTGNGSGGYAGYAGERLFYTGSGE